MQFAKCVFWSIPEAGVYLSTYCTVVIATEADYASVAPESCPIEEISALGGAGEVSLKLDADTKILTPLADGSLDVRGRDARAFISSSGC